MVVQDVVHSSPLWLYRKTGKQKKQDKRNDMKKVKKGNWPPKVLKSTNENDLLKKTSAQ